MSNPTSQIPPAGDPEQLEFRVVGPADEDLLFELLASVDASTFRPHPFTREETHRIASRTGRDCYAMLVSRSEPPVAVAYGILRGWDDGYAIASLGVAVRSSAQGQGLGRRMMECLHAYARECGSTSVRLRVNRSNIRARQLYESMGYVVHGEERGEAVMVLEL